MGDLEQAAAIPLPTCVRCGQPFDHGCNSAFCGRTCEELGVMPHCVECGNPCDHEKARFCSHACANIAAAEALIEAALARTALDDARFVVRNIERIPAMGGDPSEHDRGCVIDMERTEAHPVTGKTQNVAVFFGTIAECWRAVREGRL